MASRAADLQLGPRRDQRIEPPVGDAHGRVVVHAARQFERDVHVGGALGEGLEGLQRHAELLAHLQIIRRKAQGLVHRPDGLRAQRRRVPDECRVDAVTDVAAVTERLRGGAVEHDLGSALPVEGPVGVAGGRVRVDQEQAGPATGKRRGDDEDVGRITGQHRVFAACDGPCVALLGGAGRQLVGAPQARLEVGQGEQLLPAGHLVEQRALLGAAEFGDHTARDERGRGHRLGCQPPADLGHHDHDLDLAGLLGLETQSQDADFGQLTPHVAAPAQLGFDDLVAAFGVVAAGQHVACGVGQQLLLFGQVKVHGRPSQSQDRRGDDGALNLVATAVDRGLAEVEVTRCGVLRPRR